MKTLTFDFKSLGAGDKGGLRQVVAQFAKAGANVVSSSVAPAVSKRAGVAFRNVDFTFADGQRVTMAIKDTGDVFEVRINGSVIPVSSQDDHVKGLAEIVARMDRGRGNFQRAMAKVRIPLPAAIRTSRVTMLNGKRARRDGLRKDVDAARTQLVQLTGGHASLTSGEEIAAA